MKRTPCHPTAREDILSAANLSDAEARALVTSYYLAQDMRKALDSQIRTLGLRGECEAPPKILDLAASYFAEFEKDMFSALGKYAETRPAARWAMAQLGVGPVLASGFIAHLDIQKAPTVGHFWVFAGLDPNTKWLKGEKRPFNPAVKQLCFHFGQCAMRTHNHPDSVYGRIYAARKKEVVRRNDAGLYAERTKTYETKSADVKKKLKLGKLPDSNLEKQACNYAAKMFLSHLHAVMYWDFYNSPPPRPFAIQYLGHAHEIRVPNTEMFPGFEEAYYTNAPAIAA